MASGSPKHHVDRLGHHLGARSGSPILAPSERIVSTRVALLQITDADRADEADEFLPISMPIVGNGRDCMAGAPSYIRPIPAALADWQEHGWTIPLGRRDQPLQRMPGGLVARRWHRLTLEPLLKSPAYESDHGNPEKPRKRLSTRAGKESDRRAPNTGHCRTN
jgi:hypothetical protein